MHVARCVSVTEALASHSPEAIFGGCVLYMPENKLIVWLWASMSAIVLPLMHNDEAKWLSPVVPNLPVV